MFQCEDCGALFTEARVCVEYWGECHGRPIHAPAACCPVCGGIPRKAADDRPEAPDGWRGTCSEGVTG